ncbi:MAG: hypothetical protein FJ387_18980 [Verrucomicrobia bacterium]|nr:hypothetical protein [Verrucomicrobiota bacterium]
MTRTLQLVGAGCAATFLAVALHAQPTGQWDFDNGDLAGTVGAALTYLDTTTSQQTQFGTTTALGLPNIGGAEAKVMKFPASISPMGYRMPVATGPNGGGGFVNDWTLIFDILYPTESDGKWRAFIETDLGAFNPDADLFVNQAGGIGIGGQYHGKILPNTWHRVGFVVEASAGVIRKYIDGVQVGSQSAASGGTTLDSRWALTPNGEAWLFTDNDSDNALGYVNSIQFRNVALSADQMRALAGPQAAGIPLQLPPVPSYVAGTIPASAFAQKNTDIGFVLNMGDTTIQDSSFVLKLNGTTVASPTITRAGKLITVRKAGTAFTVPSKHTITLDYVDSLNGAQSGTHTFEIVVFYEDFDSLVLGPSLTEPVAGAEVWTKDPPTGWTVDNSKMTPQSGADCVLLNPDIGRKEWEGWTFANWAWHVQGDDQTRSLFTKARNTAAIADPDEWDDRGNPDGTCGYFYSFLLTAPIPLTGLPANSVFLRFDSSWRPEAMDDVGPDGVVSNNQTATVTASFDGGAPIEILKWDSIAGSPTFHPDSQNETVLLDIPNPTGASQMVLTFGLTNAGNDWWWAIDNILVNVGVKPPTISQQPQHVAAIEGRAATFNVVAQGEFLAYQWFKGQGAAKTPVAGATAAQFTIPAATLTHAGYYSVEVSNPGGKATSTEVLLEVVKLPASITQDLLVHLKFDNNYQDSSGRNFHGTPQGAPSFGVGKIGPNALVYSSAADGSSFNYVTLGAPPELDFGTATDFSITFWAKLVTWTGDPAFVANKNWNSGGNQGYVIATGSDGRIQWNYAGAPGSRKDYDSAGGIFGQDTWRHIALTFNRAGTVRTYVDGALNDATVITASANDVSTPTGQATNIGQDGTGTYTDGGSVSTTNGMLDDVGIWRRVLAPEEIAAIYTAGLTAKDLSTAVVGTPAVAPTITTAPASRQAIVGLRATLTVAATGTPPLAYQWRKDGANLTGQTNATLTIASVQMSDAGNYTVVVSNTAGSATSAPPATLTVVPAPPVEVTGQWDFDQGDLRATVGRDLEYFDATVQGDTSFGTTTAFGIPNIAGAPAKVLHLRPSVGSWGGYKMYHQTPPNGGGQFVNLYTIIYDVLYPAESMGKWRAFLQTNTGNSGDGDFFVNTANGIGISGNYQGPVLDNTWHRIVFSLNLDAATVGKYIDGVLVGRQTLGAGLDGRWSLDTFALLFADNDGDNAPAYVNSLQFRNWVMSDAEVAALGGVTTDGIPRPATGPKISAITRTANNVTLTWQAAPGLRLQKNAILNPTGWQDVAGTEGQGTATEPIAGSSAFYRLFKP